MKQATPANFEGWLRTIEMVAPLTPDADRLDPPTVGKALRRLREERELRQQDIAARLGLTVSGYAHYENGRARLTLVDLPRFAAAFKLSIHDLLVELGSFDPPTDETLPSFGDILRDIKRSPDLPAAEKDYLLRLAHRLREDARGHRPTEGPPEGIPSP